ncbi:unnamed protein product [Blepharisma stoltei]|uniref:EGF-like domain-containing protein n=1 Tax=Blepharisma stoltei TaxID=1481888 RepID=A0AAU9IT13_9CILI|nr:unnamed protein product [Blepharisma stoltei]
MKASIRLFSTFLLSFAFSITSKIPSFIDPSFLSPLKLVQEELQIDYIIDAKSDFDEISKQFLTELLENSIQVVSYLLQDAQATISPSASNSSFCPEIEWIAYSENFHSDIILLIANDKKSRYPLSFEDCSSDLYPAKLGLIKVNMPLLLAENDISTIYTIVESLSKAYLGNAEILEKLDEIFNSNLGASCTIACKVCNTNTGSCVTCYDSAHMKIKNGVCYCSDPNAIYFSPTNSCVCKNGYYLNSTSLCTPCPAICASCSSSTNCLSCINPTQMTLYNNWCYCSFPEGSVFNSTLNICNCPDGTWTYGDACQACNATCSSCINLDTCTSCSDSANMNLIGGICSCKDPNAIFNETLGLCKCEEGYYMENAICNACQPPCETCSNATFCNSCIISSMPLIGGNCTCPANTTFSKSEDSCVCDIGMFLNSDQVCEPCLPECATCNNATSCLTCIDPDFMTIENGICYCNSQGSFNTTTRECTCPAGQFREGSTCASCSNTGCAACKNATYCISCYTTSYGGYFNYELVNGVCECSVPNSVPQGYMGCYCSQGYYYYYMNGNKCTACPATCQSCYYDPGNPTNNFITCNSCIYPGMTYTNSRLCQCPSNSYFVTQSKSCQCNGGYYKYVYPPCTPCSLPCRNCNSPTNCTSCALPNQMTLSNNYCTCTSPSNSVYNSTMNQCTCPDQTYLNGTTCDNCAETCMSCESNTECLACIDPAHMTLESNGTCTCPANSTFKGNTCVCNNGYFWLSSEYECAKCQPPCQQCSNETTCLSCLDPYNMYLNNGECYCRDPHAVFDIHENVCVCSIGYFMSNSQCFSCPDTCSSCENNNNCTSCVNENQMSLVNGYCTCTDPSNSVFNPELSQCICPGRTYLNGTSCSICHDTCYSCENSSECLTCINPVMTLENNGTCICPANSYFIQDGCECKSQFYWNGGECEECYQTCLECEEFNFCSSCIDQNGMILNNGQCSCIDPHAYFDPQESLCLCSEGYFMIDYACWACPETCSTCDNNTNCASCIDENHMILVNGTCSCSDPNSTFISSQRMCVCNQGYQYWNNECIECPVECSLCSDSDVCIECANSEEMTIISSVCVCNKNNTVYNPLTNSCICRQQYYYDGDECVACQSPMCDVCENDRCLSCIDPINMTLESGICYCRDQNSFFNTSSSCCQCLSNYLSNLIGNALQCIPLSSPCREFSVDGICLKCADNSMELYEGQCYCLDPNTSYNKNNQNCTCNFGYQLTTYSKLCQPCDSYLNGGIMGCINCNNGQCLECQKNMVLSNGDCICKIGFVLDNILGTCVCAPGFWNSTECPSCDCYSCFANGTCLEPCAQDSFWNNGVCSCNSGFYQCGDNQCCNLDRTCSMWNSNNCGGCNGKMYLSTDLECICGGGSIYSPELNDCVCPQGEYYLNTGFCDTCTRYCNNCTNSGECISCQAPFFLQNETCTCDPNAIQSWNNCICKDGYYTGSDYSCLPCPEHCATCISSTKCTSCNGDLLLVNNKCLCSDINAVYNIEDGQCKCAAGYYGKSSKCVACLASCYNCLDDGTTCTSCADKKNMVLIGGVCSCVDPNAVFNSTTMKCECPNGYYNGICNGCGSSCSQCSNNRCYSCYDPANMVLVENSCTCIDPNSYFVEWAKICSCNSGFYYNGQICAPFPGLIFNKQIK